MEKNLFAIINTEVEDFNYNISVLGVYSTLEGAVEALYTYLKERFSIEDIDPYYTNGDKIEWIKGFQLTTYTWHEVHAKIFVDSSGDSILAPLTGAEYRVGREAKSEFGEEFGLEVADNHTMGMSLMIQCRETDHPVSYTPPAWAYDFPDDDAMNNKPHKLYEMNTNFYWIELGGEVDSIRDTETIRDLLSVDVDSWLSDVQNIREFYAQIGDSVPATMHAELDALEARLLAAK